MCLIGLEFKNTIDNFCKRLIKIDNRIEPHPIKESDFKEGSPLIYEIKKHGEIRNINVA